MRAETLKVKKITKIGLEETFDISVRKNHNYFANDILVHNSGKSWMLRGLMSRAFKSGYYCVHLSDIKNEMVSNSKPQMMRYADLLNPYTHEKPEAIPTKILMPKFLEKTYPEYPTGSIRFQLSFRDITERDLISIFGVEGDRDLTEIMKKVYSEIRELRITNFDEMADFIWNLRELHPSTKKNLVLKIENLAREDVFGDEYSTDIIGILKDKNVMALNLKGYKEFAYGYSQSYVGFIINKLRRERRTGILDKPVWMFLDEAHAFCPNKGNPPSKQEIIDVINIDRLAGISLIIATQYPEQLPKDDILKQMTHFFLPYNIDPETRKFILDLCGLTRKEDQYSDKWKKLWGKLHKYEWCYINREDRTIRKIRPAAPLCRHMEEVGF